MDIDVYSGIGLLMFGFGIIYSIRSKPNSKQWLMIVPILVFMFIGAVSNAGFSVIEGTWANASNSRYMNGAIITLLSIFSLTFVCNSNSTIEH